jgi:hypothetical protein
VSDRHNLAVLAVSDRHNLAVLVGLCLLALGFTGAWLASRLRHGPSDEPGPPGTDDLTAAAAALRERPDPRATLWRGQPGPQADWSPVWVDDRGVLGHKPANPVYTACGIRMFDHLGYQTGATTPAGHAYERLRVDWCHRCYPAPEPDDDRAPIWVQPGRRP